MRQLTFEPVDTLFFRDGRPYNKDETTQTDVVSRFPPSPVTLVGAVRAAYARALGWDERLQQDWPPHIKKVLGDRDQLNGLGFTGPFVSRNGELLFPPLALLLTSRSHGIQDGGEDSTVRLRPGPLRDCDLGDRVPLPEPEGSDAEGLKPLRDWITARGLEQVLAGGVPSKDERIDQSDLWRLEPRVGISRDAERRTTGEAAMYSPKHVRLCRGVTLRVLARGLPDGHDDLVMGRPHPVGGESRLCWLDVADSGLVLPPSPEPTPVNGKIRYTAVALTPALLGRVQPGQRIDGLPGHVVSACMPRPQLFGGWISVDRTPQALQPFISPGSVFFMKADSGEVNAVRDTHGSQIGERTHWGFGLIAIGSWGD